MTGTRTYSQDNESWWMFNIHQDSVKTKFYRHLKFVEDDIMPKIFATVVEREENKLPEGMLPQEEHNKLLTNCIRKAFTNLQHNSQTLIRRNYKRK